MSYLVLARKCRPQVFDDVVGQGHITRTLSNAIKMDRVAHGFLFSGVRGVGKTSLARILAKALNCAKGPTPDPCGECDSCRAVTSGNAVDVIEIDGASNNSVDDIRDLRETVPYRPALGRYKIYVIDEVHMLSVSAFNALLKTLEEPPPHVKFIFATTEPHKIPTTILSRCQRYDFRRIPTAAIVDRIRQILHDEGIEAEDGALGIIGREAEGSMRDALSVLDQVLAAGEEKITAESVADLLGVVSRKVFYDLSAAVLAQDPRGCLRLIREVDSQGFDMTTFARGFLEHLRNLVVASVCEDDIDLLDLPDEETAEVVAQTKTTTRDDLHRIFKHFSQAYEEIARSSHQRILFEATLARLADMARLVPADELLARLEALGSGSPPPIGSGSGGGPGGRRNSGGGSSQREISPKRSASASSEPSAQRAPTPPPTQQSSKDERPAPSPPAQPKAAPSSPARDTSLQADWKTLLDDFSKSHPAKSSIIERGVVSQTDREDLLLLKFDEKDSFAADRARDPDLQRKLAAFVEGRIGRSVEIEVTVCNLGERSTLASKRLEAQEKIRLKEEEAREHPVVKGAMAAFGGTISNVRVNNGGPSRKD